MRWLDLEAGLHEADGEPLREERLVIEYQVLSIKFQESRFKYQVSIINNDVSSIMYLWRVGRLAGGGQGDVRHLVGGVHHRPGGCK